MKKSPNHRPTLLILLATASGVAALIYEIVWFQLLELAIGSTAVSVGILLATFMGGMCAGSLLLPRVVSARRSPLSVYALIELGIGLLGVAVLRGMPMASGIYALRGAVAALVMLPSAMLMGATLPALSRAAPKGEVSWLGFLYGANIAGAVFGCLLAGFYLLRVYDVATATYLAAVINTIAALLAFALAEPYAPEERVEPALAGPWDVYFVIGLSGLCALAAEAVWTRLLGLLFGASVYALAIILAVFLIGLGMGSGIGSALCRIGIRPRLALGWSQMLAAGGIAWAAYCISASLPFWPVNPSISSNVRFNFELDLARAFWALLPATFAWGASFPLAIAAGGVSRDSGRLMSRVYTANTLGAIVGAIGASLLMVGWIGSQRTQQVLIVLAAVSSLLMLRRRWVPAAAFLIAPAVFVASVPPLPKLLVAYGRFAATWADKSDIIYAAEGVNSSVAVAKFPNGAMTFHVAGKVQASNVARDMRLQRMLGHLTTLTNAHPRSVLVIGCGAGVTAGAVSIDPRVERETIVEIERLVPRAAAAYFGEANFGVLQNSKVQVRIDDGRHYLITTQERFDGITVDPLDPWVKSAANLYTREFLEAMKRHLNPGGVVTMYIQLFETTPDAVRSAVATFFEAFPNGTVWGNRYERQGHDMVLLGAVEPLRIDLDEMEDRVGYRGSYQGGESTVARSLEEIGMDSPVDLFATYAGRASDLGDWLRGAAINRDRNLRMEYLAGIGLNRDDASSIYGTMLAYRRFPEDIFTSKEGRVESLRRAIQRER